MLLLVIDTSGRQGSVALARAGGGSKEDDVDVIEAVELTGGAFSAQLIPQIAALLEKRGLSKTDIGAFVVVSGPGSFTGLRVGLAAVKALAEVLDKPIVPVSLLEVIALAGNSSGTVLAILDAGRGEVYAGQYEVTDGAAQLQWDQLLPQKELFSHAQGGPVYTPDALLAEKARGTGLTVTVVQAVNGGMIARLGWSKLRSAETVSPEQLEANYIRRTDAEIFAKPASSS